MNRAALSRKLLELKRRAMKTGANPTHVALCGTALLKLDCTHIHGLQLTRLAELKGGQAVIFAPDADGALHPVRL